MTMVLTLLTFEFRLVISDCILCSIVLVTCSMQFYPKHLVDFMSEAKESKGLPDYVLVANL